MRYINKHQNKGFGLIEVLVALVIVAIGLLALASFESQLMLNSGDNKARSEARALAEAKIEELRDSIELDDATNGYLNRLDLVAGTFSDTTSGTNANFARAWTIADVAAFGSSTVPPRKTISVIVTWGAASAEETVSIVNEIAWIDPAKSLLSAEIQSGAGAAAQPSPRQNASEDVASETVTDGVNSDIDLGLSDDPGTSTTVTLDTITSSSDPLQTHSAVPLTQVASGSHYYATDDTSLFFVDTGVIAVFICDGVVGSATCNLIQNHFGGVVHRIRGTVSSMSGELLDDILVAWSSSDVNACYQDPASLYTSATVSKTGYNGNSTTLHTMNYECVFAGNCDAMPASDGITNGLGLGNGCSQHVSNAHIASRNVGPGGEFGELGLLGVDDRGGDREQMCFLEDTANHSLAQNVMTNGAASGDQYDDDYALPVTKRSYVTRRRNNDDTQTSEGINQSYSNHNFLILDRATGGGVSETCADLIALNSANSDFELGPRDIVRTLSTSNVVASEITYAGGTGAAITLTGTASSATELDLYVSETHANNNEFGSCYIKSDGLAYACVVPSTASTVAIEGGSSTVPSSSTTYSVCTSAVSTVAPTLTTACAWSTDF